MLKGFTVNTFEECIKIYVRIMLRIFSWWLFYLLFKNNTEKINSLLFIRHEKMNMCLIPSLNCLFSPGFLLSLSVSHSVLQEIFSMNLLNLLIIVVVANGYAPASDVFCLLKRSKVVDTHASIAELKLLINSFYILIYN